MTGSDVYEAKGHADELARLVETLHETQQRIRELTAGSVDAVTHSSGPSYLLADAQDYLRASEAAQRRHAAERAAILDAIPSHLALLDESGRIVAVNEAWRRFARANGLSGENAAVGESYLDVCDRVRGEASETASEAAAGVRAVLSGQVPRFMTKYPCHAPGEPRWFRMIVVPVRTPDHMGALVIHRDITAQSIAEIELDKVNDLLRIAGRVARIGGWSIDLGAERVEWSDEVCRIRDVEPGTAVTVEQAIAFYAPEWRGRIMAMFDACRRDGTPYDDELEIISAKGHRRWVRTIGEAVRDEAGRIVRVQGAFQDISEQKRAEAALIVSERRFREFADALPQLAWTAEPDGTVDFVNRAFYEVVGTIAVDLRNGEWLSFLHPDDRQRVVDVWSAAVRSGTDYAVDFRLRGVGGDYRWYLVTATPIRDETGTIVKWYGTALDDHERWTVEQENRRLAERLSRTFESISDGLYIVDREWRFTFVNDQAERLIRHERAQLLGRTPWEVFDAEATRVLRPAYERAVREGRSVRFEFFHPRLEMWFDVTAYPSEEGLAVYFRDVTERHSAEERLRESEARFRAVARATADVIWDWDLKTGAVWWSDGLELLFGYSKEDVGTGVDTWTDHVHPDDRDRVMRSIAEAIERRDEHWQDEYRFVHKDGSVREIEDRGYLILDEQGEPARAVGGMSDITERKRAEQRIAEQAALLDQARDAIVVRSFDGGVSFWNRGAEHIYGWTRDEAIGQSMELLLYDDPEPFRRAWEAVMAQGEWRGRLAQRRKDGSAVTVEANWTLLHDGTGAPRGFLAINTDITQRLVLEEQLRQAQRLETVGQLTGGVAHDFNNLLTVILGNAELLVEDLGAESPPGALAATMRLAAERGAELTARLLAFARRQPLDPKPVDLNRMIGDTDALLRRTLGEQVEIETVRGGGLWNALVDPPQLESALLNLCINARDAMGSGGKLTIETANVRLDDEYVALHADVAPGQYVMLAVSDTGTGMTADVVSRAFEPFFTTKPAGKGSGLGLSMVYGFVKQSGGHVGIYSELGQGTTIRLYLPRAPIGAEQSVGADTGPAIEGGSETILVVEDDALVREHVADQLRSLGYSVLTAQNGAEALDHVRSDRRLDVLFTDVVMPGGMNGRELADAARSVRPRLPVLFTSGYTENAVVHHGRLDPGVHLLQKPYRRQQLAAKIRQVLVDKKG